MFQSKVILYIEILTSKGVHTVQWCNIAVYSAEHSLSKMFNNGGCFICS